MQNHLEMECLNTHHRRMLMGDEGGKILLVTPLLNWYLDHGMKVTRVYQVVEFNAEACFKSFVNIVTEARRAGDEWPEMEIIGNTMKLMGNSGYGSVMMDKTKHCDIKYVKGDRETCLAVNQDKFRNVTCLEEEFYEIEMAETKIVMDLPIQLGYFILHFAKLKMLEFNHDFLDVYVDRSDKMLLGMDTDSNYLCLRAENLRDVIKPEIEERFDHHLRGICRENVARNIKKIRQARPETLQNRIRGGQDDRFMFATYVVSNGEEFKFSSKGINKNNVRDARIY